MYNKVILENPSLTTQATESVVELLKYMCKPEDPLPEAIKLTGMVLVLGSKKDSYYVVTPEACSCPSFIYRGGPCKHQRKYFPGPEKSQLEIEAESDAEIERLHEAKWAGGFNGPVDPDTINQRRGD